VCRKFVIADEFEVLTIAVSPALFIRDAITLLSNILLSAIHYTLGVLEQLAILNP